MSLRIRNAARSSGTTRDLVGVQSVEQHRAAVGRAAAAAPPLDRSTREAAIGYQAVSAAIG